MSLDDHLIFLLQQYHKHGIASRLGLVLMFIEEVTKFLKANRPQEISDDTFGLTNEQKIATLQMGIISNLMMVVEDIGLLCYSFMKDDSNFYQYLDSKGKDELGKIIHEFYSKIPNLTNKEMLKILSYVHPEKYSFKNEKEREVFIKVLMKSIDFSKYFLGKAMVFRESHIAVYRRFKHAIFPILLANKEIYKVDEMAKKYDFVSYAFTSRQSVSDEIVSIPFSKKIVESYQTFMIDIYLFLRTIVNSRLICLQRKVDGVFPYRDDFIAKKFSPNDRKILDKIWQDFENQHPVTGEGYKFHFDMLEKDTSWYVNLDFYSKKAMELAERTQT